MRQQHNNIRNILLLYKSILFNIFALCSGSKISGPYLFWGHSNVSQLQPRALVPANAHDLENILSTEKVILFSVESTSQSFDWKRYPKFQELIEKNQWAYLPQQNLAIDPFQMNENISFIELNGDNVSVNDELLVASFNNALDIYGSNSVLGILGIQQHNLHKVFKRQATENEDERRAVTTQTPLVEETDESSIYIAEDYKAALYVSSAPILVLAKENKTIILDKHNKHVTFDDQRAKGYCRFNIIFIIDKDKRILRFNFTLDSGTWYMGAVEIQFNGNKTVLPAVGDSYSLPSAPLGFSYRCSARDLVFTNKEDTLTLSDFQIQPWLGGKRQFDYSYNCVGFFTSAIWSGILISFFLGSILFLAIIVLMEVRTPNRFESSRSKQLTFTVQE